MSSLNPFVSQTPEYFRWNSIRRWEQNRGNPDFLERKRISRRRYGANNKPKLKAYNAAWNNSNRELVRARNRVYASNPTAKAATNLRRRLRGFIKSGERRLSTAELVGCTQGHLIRHIEQQFVGRMAWSNYGRSWHIDHKNSIGRWRGFRRAPFSRNHRLHNALQWLPIVRQWLRIGKCEKFVGRRSAEYRRPYINQVIPCAAFDLSIEAERKRCNHWTNLQPLWKKANMSKGATVNSQMGLNLIIT